MSQPTVKKYPAEFKERAVKLAVESDLMKAVKNSQASKINQEFR